MKIPGAALMLTGLLLAGCSTAPSPEEASPPKPDYPPAPEDACGAQAVGSITGQILDDETYRWIEDRSRASNIRVVEPGKAYTMEFREDRLNVKVDEQRMITELSCG